MTEPQTGPLRGLKIVDISTVVAGPFAAGLLGDYGAQVLKVEMPGVGDTLRALAPHKDGAPLWWKVTNRNKKGVTLDLRQADGRALFGKLIADADVLVENFRPGTLDGWGLTRDWLQAINPRLTILRLTGFGQDGPYRDRPGFARIFEAMSGFTQICGEEDGRPLHLGYPISDAVAGLFGAVGIFAALHDLARNPARRGQEIDCSATEAMLRTLEFLAIEYDQLGAVRAPARAIAANMPRRATSTVRPTASGHRSPPRRKAFSCGSAGRSTSKRCSPTSASPPILPASGTTAPSTRSWAPPSAG